MLLVNLERINKLDQEIVSMQQKLTHMYRQRSQLSAPRAVQKTIVTADTAVDRWYDKLSQAWEHFSITIPAAATLHPRIQRALKVRQLLAAELGTAPDMFTLVLIPPQRLLSSADISQLRMTQTGVMYSDQDDTDINEPAIQRWRLLVVYDSALGLPWGSAADITNKRKYLIKGYDTRALGIREYSIYVLQQPLPIDTDSWVWLLKHETPQPVSVTFLSGAYRFSHDDPQGYLQTERFRPAVEVS